ncbi:rCG36098 [Rattus norvegicus]|uniref:RCG36098 n=1 Tax=Rattus norvegicus TaxID=10116 RepID=A6IJE9_RAT|nr:rCG36098 [Rattus norvegicus]
MRGTRAELDPFAVQRHQRCTGIRERFFMNKYSARNEKRP